jgi:hypothetical protein
MHAEKQINANERTGTLAEDQVDDLRMQSQDIRGYVGLLIGSKGSSIRTRRRKNKKT